MWFLLPYRRQAGRHFFSFFLFFVVGFVVVGLVVVVLVVVIQSLYLHLPRFIPPFLTFFFLLFPPLAHNTHAT